ncbi:plastocyanin/azurin family copper-binding protein [Natrinema sp. SYSU A 869]|uniref:plastocyanin/azurin family copper-binding protein n=1 Tax=Natrinema sp. SYSU A 869 TaxID=2871694 RepID=UPI001CA3DC2E|nr:plastocyanin/azurin family copper-binding protein [Natrinema sp. SYSU A 869]
MPSDCCDRRTILRLSGAALATIGTAGCLNRRSSTDRTVTMTGDFGFDPAVMTIGTDRTVIWENTSNVDHTVTASEAELPDDAAYFASGGFESERAARNNVTAGLFSPNSEYERTFEVPGTYEYYCIPHESSGMVGTVQVE